MNQKCLTTIFVPVHPLNFNVNPPSVCQIHQKPLSYYNKYKPGNEPICTDCLLNEIKEGKGSNLYLPISNLEQEYYYQKNAFCQILEQANNMKKYDTHITNFQRLLTNYFSQFIRKFVNERIFRSLPQRKVEFCDKNNTVLNCKDMMSLLYKVENEKFILENKSADVFGQLNILQKILLKSHEKLAEAFNNLLWAFFVESKTINYLGKDNSSDKSCPNEKNNSNLNSSNKNSSSKKSADIPSSSKYVSKTSNEGNISLFSHAEDVKESCKEEKNKDISNIPSDININMEKEQLFEDNIEFNIEEELKKNPFHNDLNNSFSEKANCEIFEKNKEKENKEDDKVEAEPELERDKEKQDEGDELPWRRKKIDENDEIYREHKDKINKLIEHDKNKKALNTSTNQSFYKRKKNNFKKNHRSSNLNLNKSFQKYNPTKFTFSKRIEYKQYNQFTQKSCRKCGSSFVTTRDEEICQNCKYTSDDERLKKRGNRDFQSKKGKFFFQNNYPSSKRSHIQPHGVKKYQGNKNEAPFNRNFNNKSMIHSNSNYSKHYGKNMGSPKGFDDRKKIGKYKMNKGKEKYDDNFGKNNGPKKYYEKKNRDNNKDDDFEVDLDSGEENDGNSQGGKDTGNNKGEMTFTKTTFDEIEDTIFKKNRQNSDDNDDENEKDNDSEKRDEFDENKNGESENDEISEKTDNNQNSDDDNGDNDGGSDNGDNDENDFETDF